MPEAGLVNITVNGKQFSVPAGTVAAAAVARAGLAEFRAAVRGGTGRGPVCGMGVCFECRVTINGVPHERSCLILCQDGMELRTDDAATA